MQNRKINRWLVIAILASLIFSALGNFIIGYLSYNKFIEQDNTGLIYLISKPYIEKINTAVKYGQSIEEFYGIEGTLDKNKKQSQMIKEVSVVLPSKVILYSTEEAPGNYIEDDDQIEHLYTSSEYFVAKSEKGCNLFFPIKENSGKLVARYRITLDESLVKKSPKEFIWENILYLIAAIGIGSLVLVFALNRYLNQLQEKEDKDKAGRMIKVNVMFMSVCIILLSQLILLVPIVSECSKSINDNMTAVSKELGDNLYKQIKEVEVEKKIEVKDLVDQYHLQEWISRYAKDIEQIDSAGISLDGSIPQDASFVCPDEKSDFKIWVKTSEVQRQRKYVEVFAESLGILLLIFIILREITKHISSYLEAEKEGTKIQRAVNHNFKKLRLEMFIISTICYMPIPFVPFITMEMQNGDAAAAGYAMGICAAGIIIGAAATWILTERINWKTFLKAGLFFIIIGYGISAYTTVSRYFLIARLISGVGEGIFVMALQSFILHERTDEGQMQLTEELNGGRLNGISCGVILGSILFGNLGRRYVYLFCIAIAIVFYILQIRIKDIPGILREKKRKEDFMAYDRVHLYIYKICMIIPMGMMVMFIYYYIPMYFLMDKSTMFRQGYIIFIFLPYAFIMGILGQGLYGVLRRRRSSHTIALRGFGILAVFCIFFSLIVQRSSQPFMISIISVEVVALLVSLSQKGQLEHLKEINRSHSVLHIENYKDFYLTQNLGQMVAPTIFSLAFNAKIVKDIDMTNVVGIIGVVSLVMLILYSLYAISRPIQE